MTPTELMADAEAHRATRAQKPRLVPGPAHIYPGAIDPIWCADALEVYARRDDWVSSPSYELSSILTLTNEVSLGDPFICEPFVEISRILAEVDREHWGLTNWILPHVQILRYDAGSRQDWHCDGTLDDRRRWVGIVVMLSDPDEYEGGELVIKDQGEHRPERGTLVLLPGDCWHQVETVTAGVRQVIAAFACTPELELW